MTRYRKLMLNNSRWLKPEQIAEEVDFNFGRAFQGLGKGISVRWCAFPLNMFDHRYAAPCDQALSQSSRFC